MTPAGPREPFDALDRRTPASLDAWWARRMRELFALAHAELPFYRTRFDAAGFDPASFRTLADLARVPRFAKADVLAAQARLGRWDVGVERLAGHEPIVLSSSSGTKGTTFLAHPPSWRRSQGRSALRAHFWAGLRPGTPFLLSAPAWHSYAAVQTFIAEQFGLPCVVIAGTYLPRFAGRIVEAILRFRPRFLTMFLPMVFSLASEARRRGIAARELFGGIEALVVTGAPVTPGMRAHVAQTLGVRRLVEIAGTSESLLAVECTAESGLHVVPDTCYVEVLDPRTGEPVAPGGRGSAVHTCVVAHGSMYLRYDGGDAAVIDRSPCPCGLPSPRIKLLGRHEDAFVLGGRALLPYDVQLAMEEEVPELVGSPAVILRDGLAEGRLDLVLPPPEAGAPAGLADRLAQRLRARLGVAVSARVADHLPVQFKGVPPVLSGADTGHRP
ncbi:MAG TPA: AMP-binding protein [Myxococcota bacterium]|jgi:phenylacetate-CoA ligase|nr:AMP-binding protein [Myxococcota bacterium]